jgi:hypothetical protein
MSSIGTSGKAAGGQLEEKIDLTPETDAKLEQSAALAKSGQVREALAILAALEKRCRVGNDPKNLVRVCEASLQYCKDAGDDELLLTTLQTLTTRRSQKKQAISALVHIAIPWCVVDQYTPMTVSSEEEKAARDKLVEALRGIADGKLFLEGELARLTRALAIIKVRFSMNIIVLLYIYILSTLYIHLFSFFVIVLISGTRRRYCRCCRCLARSPRRNVWISIEA